MGFEVGVEVVFKVDHFRRPCQSNNWLNMLNCRRFILASQIVSFEQVLLAQELVIKHK